jgi:hypothetical protein
VWTVPVVIVAGWSSLWSALLYHAARGVEIESLYANAVALAHWVFGLPARTGFSPSDFSRVVHSPLDTWIDGATTAASVVLLLLVLGIIARGFSRAADQRGSRSSEAQLVVTSVAAILLAFMLAFRALPAHYLLAVLPVGVIVRLRRPCLQRIWVLSLFGVELFGLAVIASWHALVSLQPWAIVFLTLRNLAWLGALLALIVTLWQWQRGEQIHRLEPLDSNV